MDYTNDGKVDRTTTYLNDVYGRKTDEYIDYTSDGSFDRHISYVNDINGYIVKQETDYTNDGSMDRAEYYTRDAIGSVIKTEIDSNNDQTIDATITYTYNALGQVITESTDSNNDTLIDSVVKYERDVYGNAITRTSDTNNDSIIDIVGTSVFNELGQATTVVNQFLDGRIRTAVYTYDEYGRVITDDAKWEKNSVVFSIYRYTNVYDDTTNQTSTIHYDNRSNGTIDWTATITRDTSFIEAETKWVQTYPSGEVRTYNMEVDSLGRAEFTYADVNTDGVIEGFHLGDRNGTSAIARSADLTTWSDEQLSKLGDQIVTIRLGSLSADTLTLNSEVVSKISQGTINIYTEGTDDTINLQGGFTKTTDAAKKIDKQTYDLYSATVGSETVNLYIDEDTSVVLS